MAASVLGAHAWTAGNIVERRTRAFDHLTARKHLPSLAPVSAQGLQSPLNRRLHLTGLGPAGDPQGVGVRTRTVCNGKASIRA